MWDCMGWGDSNMGCSLLHNVLFAGLDMAWTTAAAEPGWY